MIEFEKNAKRLSEKVERVRIAKETIEEHKKYLYEKLDYYKKYLRNMQMPSSSVKAKTSKIVKPKSKKFEHTHLLWHLMHLVMLKLVVLVMCLLKVCV